MDPWFARATVRVGSLVMVLIRAPHGRRSRAVPVRTSRKGTREAVLLTIAWISFFLPLLRSVRPVVAFAAHPLHPAACATGVACMASGLWLFHGSHADLGANGSISLEVRERHRLVTEGGGRRIRHPMYAALLLDSLGLALVPPNRIAGPSYLVAMLLLVAFRVGPEERVTREAFGGEYDAYASRTKRIVPGVW